MGHLQGLSNWADMVGKENMTVRLFDRKALLDSDAVHDFVYQLSSLTKCDLSSFNYDDTPANTSISAEQMIALQDYRRDFNPGYDTHWVELVVLMNKLRPCADIAQTRPRLKPTTHNVLAANNTEAVQRTDSLFGTDFAAYFGMADRHPIVSEKPFYFEDEYDIASILDSYRPESVAAFKELIPAYNAATIDPTCYSVHRLPIGDAKALFSYAKFLQAVGLHPQAAATASHVASLRDEAMYMDKPRGISLSKTLEVYGINDQAIENLEQMTKAHPDDIHLKLLLRDMLMRMRHVSHAHAHPRCNRAQ